MRCASKLLKNYSKSASRRGECRKALRVRGQTFTLFGMPGGAQLGQDAGQRVVAKGGILDSGNWIVGFFLR
jgi:hypothetical protein